MLVNYFTSFFHPNSSGSSVCFTLAALLNFSDHTSRVEQLPVGSGYCVGQNRPSGYTSGCWGGSSW